MQLPTLSHLQFQIMAVLRGGEQSGQHIRDKLAEHGVKRAGPSFYQLMARLEATGLVKGHYAAKPGDAREYKERRYKLTASGVKAWDATKAFYATHIAVGSKRR